MNDMPEPQSLPERSKRRGPNGDSRKNRDFAVAAAETHPLDSRWIRYVGQEKWSNSETCRVVAARVNSGRQWGVGFEARVADGVLFVRFVG